MDSYIHRFVDSQIHRFIDSWIHGFTDLNLIVNTSTLSFFYKEVTTMSEFISKTTLSNLFHTSLGYHRRRLREIFRSYYKPNADVVWTTNMPQQVINDLLLHLSWDLGHRVFYMNREQLGTRIICRFKELGIFLFMKHVIVNDLTNN